MARSIARVYFDVNVFRQLFLEDGTHYSRLAELHHLVGANRLRVFGSAMQFEELFGLINKNIAAYRQASPRVLKLIGPFFLRDRSELCSLEFQKRKQLSDAEACVPQRLLPPIRALVDDPKRAEDIRTEIDNRHQHYREAFSKLADTIEAKLSSQGIERKHLQHEVKGAWTVSRAQVDDWIRSCPDVEAELQRPLTQRLSAWQMPVFRSWYAFAIAHAYKTIIDGRQIQASDRGDWDHYAYAAIPGLLVTDDRKLREIASHIELRHVGIASSQEFFDSVE